MAAPLMMGVVEVSENDIKIISMNPTVARFFELDEKTMLGKTVEQLGMPKDTIKDWIKFYRHALETGQSHDVGYWHETGQGKRFLSGKINFIEYDKNGKPLFSFIIQDTTEMKLARQELERQENFLETILDNIPDMIFVKDAKDLRFLKFNKAGEDLIGYNRRELIGKNDYDFFPPEQANDFTGMDKKVFEGRRMVEIAEEPIETRFRGKRILHTKKIPLFTPNGQPQFLVGISEDITEKKEAQEMQKKVYQEQVARQEIEKLLEARDEFISIASHELKSPLSSLILQAQMFKRNVSLGRDDLLSKEKIISMMDLTEKQVLRLDRLVNDMLDVSRIRTGKLKIDRMEFNLYDLIQDVLIRMKEQFLLSDSGEPKFTYTSRTIVGSWDHLRIEQVILNLLTNAIRYGGGGPIEVHLSQEKNFARVSVRDHGIGIAPELHEKIFDRFVRAINPSEVSGLGLGLFISMQIVKAHGGRMWVESKIGKGSTFFVELPLSK